MIKHSTPVEEAGQAVPGLTSAVFARQKELVKQIRLEVIQRYRPALQSGSGPIRVMARMVAEAEQRCRKAGIADQVIQAEFVNRTLGDVDLRKIVECEGEPGGMQDYRMLADEVGIALPGEEVNGYRASGKTYLLLRHTMMEYERMLLRQHIDLRVYDMPGIGNPVLRGWLAESMQQWGIKVGEEQIFLSQGSLNGIDRTLRGLCQYYDEQALTEGRAMLCPSPGFTVPEQQARFYGYRIHHVQTMPQNHFKVTAEQVADALEQAPDIRVIYLIITNNPTTFALTADELRAIYEVLRSYRAKGRKVLVLADLAYIGTGRPEDDQARMAAFKAQELLPYTIFASSFSKAFSLTGDSMGWITIGDPDLAERLRPTWASSVASQPAEWQLRYMAYLRYFQENTWITDKLRNFYRYRRRNFIAELRRLHERTPLFAEIYLDDNATIYNWSKLQPGHDAFTLFERVGLAGVPGSGFGYTDDYIRFSIGTIPVTTA